MVALPKAEIPPHEEMQNENHRHVILDSKIVYKYSIDHRQKIGAYWKDVFNRANKNS